MKKKFIYLSILFIGLLFIPFGVKAADEEYSITIKATGVGEAVDSTLTATLNGIEKHESGYPSYYVYICKSSDSAPTLPTTGSPSTSYYKIAGWHGVTSSTGEIGVSDDLYLYKDYTSAYVLKITIDSSANYIYTLSDKITFTLPDLFKKGEGYNFAIGTKTTTFHSVWPKFPYRRSSSSEDTKAALEETLNIKIGVVDDSTIINKYAKNSSDAYESLLTYAKNAPAKWTFKNNADISTFENTIDNIVSGTYYYVLIYSDNDDIRDVTDVYLKIGSNINTLTDFEGTASTLATKLSDSSEPNPNTMDINVIVGIITIVVASIVFVITYKKFRRVN